MANLEFTCGAMGSSKTALALMKNYSLKESGFNVLLLKPSTDSRDGTVIIKSRVGIEAEAKTYDNDDNLLEKFLNDILDCDCIIIDEVQFSTKEQVRQMKTIAEEFGKPVYTYGLRTDFLTNFFEGSEELFKLADVIDNLSIKCPCGNEAIVNARYDENGIIYEGSQILLGSNDKYKALCLRCYKKGRLNGRRN